MDMMTRRRAMMAGIAVPEWDVEWNASKGLPENNGFTKTVTGTPVITLTDSYLELNVSKSHYVRYNKDSDVLIGVIEVEASIPGSSDYITVYFGNGQNELSVRMQYNSSYKGIYLRNASDLGSMTKLQSVSQSTKYKITVIKRANDGDVYINDVLKASNVDLTTIPYQSTYKGIYVSGISTNKYKAHIHAIRLKLGRTS